MPRFAANLSFLFLDLPFLDRFEAAANAGFKGVEFTFPYAHDAKEIRARLDAAGLEMVLFNLPPGHWDKGERGYTAIPDREDEFASAVNLALSYAETLRCRKLHAMAGLVAHGANRETYIENLRLAASWARPDGVEILIEPINTRDMPGYFLTRTEDAIRVMEAVDADNLKLQFDCYHREIMEGGLLPAISLFGPVIAHYQWAQPPDRGEPDKGVIDYRAVYRAIEATGFNGWIGCEYKPRGDTLAGLSWVKTLGLTL